ncbi:GTPase ObgE [Anaerosalibacter bizertensis]|uniref:GTPase Obg n=1 Tax=Anaerosalibacter bizertensis TaxID=932217 RepID=A0A844FI31_9FIRM|nr:GTPase ObgE [Anaerosalibacter bizertensis]MBV1817695.1 GTPase ObgE [Bacteroidales bacterium MSK.15.36]HHV27504.1 GTPase ObgE [Tissierellia bacterium]MBU5294049.1 GTPase ObgE [Anaerosalibacter bizertensis]MCB5559987.1 GTPase ObgE [Anaerosalibacter bizertensis]MCG4565157.1 GTPase ObgE [Anaerosalibacter bizertensis]
MFVDIAKIRLKAGKGGDGAVAFRREKYEPSGGPYGGDGGDGGSIILQVDEGLKTLMDFKYKRVYKAENGEDGKTKKQYGKSGKDLVLRIPPGTVVKDLKTGGVIIDFKDKDEIFVIAKGGRGGKGNAKFATSTRQAPRFSEAGEKGEEREIILELKLLADVGLVGFPNVGKSTLLSMMSAAKPKIANYHFTTLKPNLGVVRVEEGKSFVMADIPGLIEGAHEGAGLGHEFLRHVERTRLIVHVIDASGIEGRNPLDDFYKINEELKNYNPKLSKKPQIVVANKKDIGTWNEGYKILKEKLEKEGYRVLPVSAATGEGVDKLKYIIWEELSKIEADYETFDEVVEFKETEEKEEIVVKLEEGKFIVEGAFIEKLVYSTNFDDLDSLRYFQNTLIKKGIVEKLKSLGIEENDTVYICGFEFEFFD